MKRLLALFLAFICLFGYAYSESPATPTDLDDDLIEIDDDDCGEITSELLERQVFLDFLKPPQFYGEEVTLVAILVNFLPDDNITFAWEYSKDGEEWHLLHNATEQTYTFIIDKNNCYYHWRVKVTVHHEIEDYDTPLGLNPIPAIACNKRDIIINELEYDNNLYVEILQPKILIEILNIYNNRDFHIIKTFDIILDKEYETTKWYFDFDYNNDSILTMILIGQNKYILVGEIKDSIVEFDFTNIPIGEYKVILME